MGIIQPAQIKSCAICSTHAPFGVLIGESCCGVKSSYFSSLRYMMHAMLFMHFVFGTFLVYTGIKTLTADEEDEALFWQSFCCVVLRWIEVFKFQRETYWTVMTVMMKFVQDPSQNPMVKWLQEKARFVWFGLLRFVFWTNWIGCEVSQWRFLSWMSMTTAERPELQKTLHTMDGNGLKHLAVPLRSSGVGSATFWITKCNYSNNFFASWETPSSLKLFFFV